MHDRLENIVDRSGCEYFAGDLRPAEVLRRNFGSARSMTRPRSWRETIGVDHHVRDRLPHGDVRGPIPKPCSPRSSALPPRRSPGSATRTPRHLPTPPARESPPRPAALTFSLVEMVLGPVPRRGPPGSCCVRR
jgi:hypothetical protein